MTALLDPEGLADQPDEVLLEQQARWRRIGRWDEAHRLACDLVERRPDDLDVLREAAWCAAMAGDDASCAAVEARIALLDGAPTADDRQNSIAALIRLGAYTQAAHHVEVSGLADSGDWEQVDFAARAWWELGLRLREVRGEGDRRWHECATRGLETALAMVPLVHDDARGYVLLERLWGWLGGLDPVPAGLSGRVVGALQELAGREDFAATRAYAAWALADVRPEWVLETVPPRPDDATVTDARARALLTLQDHTRAAAALDELARVSTPLPDLPHDSFLRFQWTRALIETGRFMEAEEAIGPVLPGLAAQEADLRTRLGAEDGRPLAEDVRSTPEAYDLRWTATLRVVYALEIARVHFHRGRFTESWAAYVEASRMDDTHVQDAARSSLAHARMVVAPTPALAAYWLHQIWSRHDPGEQVVDGQLDTAAVDSSLWAAGRWERADGVGGTGEATDPVLREARARGLVAARELVAQHRPQPELAPQCLRLALLAGDELVARALVQAAADRSGEAGDGAVPARWDWLVLRAVTALQNEEDVEALDHMRLVMAERRSDLDLRVLYAHTALLAGELDEAAQECLEIVDMAPGHTAARIVRAECLFEMALRRRSVAAAGDAADPERTSESRQEAVAMENVQQLMSAVADYHEAIVLDRRTKLFLRDGSQDHGQLGADLLTPRQVMQVSRRGLHAAIIAQEGLDRLGLTGDRTLKRRAAVLVCAMRATREHTRCTTCERAEPGATSSLRHRLLAHGLDRDEASRLRHLMTWYRRASRLRLGRAVGSVVLGLALAYAVLVHPVWAVDRFPGLGVTTVQATLLALSILLVALPFVRSIRLGGFELHRMDKAPPISGRSKALRASSVLQRNVLLTSSTASLPTMIRMSERSSGTLGNTVSDATEPDKHAGSRHDADRSAQDEGGGRDARRRPSERADHGQETHA